MWRWTCCAGVTLGVVLMWVGVSSKPVRGDAPVGKSAGLDRLAWLQGTWIRIEGDRRVDEVWMAPAGDAMLGIGRTVAGDRVVNFEFMRIEETEPGTIVFHGSPDGRCPPTPFPMVELTGERVVFENPAHDFPSRVIYWRDTNRALHARIEGKVNGEPRQMNWSWPPQSK